MAQATYVGECELIDFTPTSAVAAGDVIVQGDLVGVAQRSIAANEVGSLAIEGAFDFAKAAGTAFSVGTILYWDDTNNIATATASGNKEIGKVVRAAAADDATVRIKLRQ